MSLQQVLLINPVTGKEPVSGFCCCIILAGKREAVAHPPPEFLHETFKTTGTAAIAKDRRINFLIEPMKAKSVPD